MDNHVKNKKYINMLAYILYFTLESKMIIVGLQLLLRDMFLIYIYIHF